MNLWTLPIRGRKLFLLVHNLGINNWSFVFLAAFGLRSAGFRTGLLAGLLLPTSPSLLRSRFVKLSRNRLPGFVEFLAGGFDRRRVAAFERLFHFVNRALNLALGIAGQFVGIVLEHFFGAIDRVVRFVARLDFFAMLLVLVGVRFGILTHLLNFVLRKTAASGNGNLLLLARAEVLRAHVQDAVCVYVERNLNLRHTARRRWYVC